MWSWYISSVWQYNIWWTIKQIIWNQFHTLSYLFFAGNVASIVHVLLNSPSIATYRSSLKKCHIIDYRWQGLTSPEDKSLSILAVCLYRSTVSSCLVSILLSFLGRPKCLLLMANFFIFLESLNWFVILTAFFTIKFKSFELVRYYANIPL